MACPESAAGVPQTVAELLRGDGLRAAYQPIVEIASESVMGYEALARGPSGSPLEMPAVLFEAARSEGLLEEMDRACREVALRGAVAAGLDPALLLFVNVEPEGLDSNGVLGRRAEGHLTDVSVVVELTERALTARPSEVLLAVRWLRERNCRIALDDVGLDPRSLALMPFLAPDVIKLDAGLLHETIPPLDIARVLHAVGAEAERSGAVVLAEGIESGEHLKRAEAMGATLGQGWLFGRPGPLRAVSQRIGAIELPRRMPASEALGTPFDLIADERRLRRGDPRLLLSLSRHLEQEALGLRSEAVVLATFQNARYFTAQSRGRYAKLAESAALVGVLGAGLGLQPAIGVRGADLSPEDPLCLEWDVIVVAPHFAGAFVAREMQVDSPELERQFDYFVTYDRTLVTAAARSLLRRIIRSI